MALSNRLKKHYQMERIGCVELLGEFTVSLKVLCRVGHRMEPAVLNPIIVDSDPSGGRNGSLIGVGIVS